MPGGLPHLASLRFSGPESRACCPAKTVPWPGKPSAMPEPLAGSGRSSDDGQVMLPLPPGCYPAFLERVWCLQGRASSSK